jgi:hypothetical protein
MLGKFTELETARQLAVAVYPALRKTVGIAQPVVSAGLTNDGGDFTVSLTGYLG